MKELGNKVRERTRRRTKSGLDINNKKFKKYTTEYMEKKKTNVNLTLTGKMLKDISVKAKKNAVEIKAKDKKAKYHQYMGAGKSKVIRTWFGIGKDFERILKVLIGREFRRINKKKVK